MSEYLHRHAQVEWDDRGKYEYGDMVMADDAPSFRSGFWRKWPAIAAERIAQNGFAV